MSDWGYVPRVWPRRFALEPGASVGYGRCVALKAGSGGHRTPCLARVFLVLLVSALASGCGPEYDGPNVAIASELAMFSADHARCGDLDIAVDEDPAQLIVNDDEIPIGTNGPIRRIGFSGGCSLAFVESYMDNEDRRISVVNLFTNAKGTSEAPDSEVVETVELGTYLVTFVSRGDSAWVMVWQDPATGTWTAIGTALETIYDDRVHGLVIDLDRRPNDVNLHIDDRGRATHWVVGFFTGDPMELPLS